MGCDSFSRKNLKPRIVLKILSWYFNVGELFEGTTSEIADGKYWTFTRNFESWQFVILLKYFPLLNGQTVKRPSALDPQLTPKRLNVNLTD